MPSLTDYPAVIGKPVTEGHARICRERGHATLTQGGKVAPWCPRCGEDRDVTARHVDGTVCARATSSRDCPRNHRYGA